MRRSTRNKAEGKYHEVKGKTKERAGKITGNLKWQSEGQREKLAGKAQNLVGKLEGELGT